MTDALRKIQTLWAEISPYEKEQALQMIFNSLDLTHSLIYNNKSSPNVYVCIYDLNGRFNGIDKTEGVCGGEARIMRTRIPVWLLVRQKELGITDQEILSDYPTLREEDLHNAWNYYSTHKTEINNLIKENEEA
jgi:uncharacterized protein (DUF433 family)